VLVFFIKELLLVPLEVPWDDFDFSPIFAEIFGKKSAQRCMIHRGTTTLRCILHPAESPFGDVRYTTEAIAKQIKSTTALKGTILQKIDQNFNFLPYSMMNMNFKFYKVCSFRSIPRCILHRGNDFIFKYLHKFLAKIKNVPGYL